jgi:hypothetical protein
MAEKRIQPKAANAETARAQNSAAGVTKKTLKKATKKQSHKQSHKQMH